MADSGQDQPDDPVAWGATQRGRGSGRGSDAPRPKVRASDSLPVRRTQTGPLAEGSGKGVATDHRPGTVRATYTLEKGQTYTITVTLPERRGKRYSTWRKTVTADFRGTRTLRAALDEVSLATGGAMSSAAGPGPALGKSWTVPDLGMEFVFVREGSFKMGSNDGDSDEKPVHTVLISKPFWIGKYEVTQAEYESFMGKNPSNLKGQRNPVETVSWHDAVTFCRKLTERGVRNGEF